MLFMLWTINSIFSKFQPFTVINITTAENGSAGEQKSCGEALYFP